MTSLTETGAKTSPLFQQRRCAALCPVTISVHRQGVQHVDSLPAVVNDLTLICARDDAPRASAFGAHWAFRLDRAQSRGGQPTYLAVLVWVTASDSAGRLAVASRMWSCSDRYSW